MENYLVEAVRDHCPRSCDQATPDHSSWRVLPSKIDAAAEAALVVSGFRSGIRALLDSCARTHEAVRRYRADPASLDAFLAVLVGGNVISPNKARLGKASPKLIEFCAIGAHGELLKREEIFQYLELGYTVILSARRPYNTLRGDEDARLISLFGSFDKSVTCRKLYRFDRGGEAEEPAGIVRTGL